MISPFLAVTTIDKLKQIPSEFWIRLAILIGGIIAVVIFLRKVAHMNKIILAIVLAVVGSIVGFNWIYERNEPSFLTPVIDHIAPFFPAKDSYNVKQQQKPKGAP